MPWEELRNTGWRKRARRWRLVLSAPATIAATFAAGTLGFGTRLIHVDRPPAELRSVKTGNSLFAFFRVRHLHETEST